MKTQTTWIASLLIAAVGQTGAFAQDICVDMNKVYPEKTIRLDEVASVRYIPLGTNGRCALQWQDSPSLR